MCLEYSARLFYVHRRDEELENAPRYELVQHNFSFNYDLHDKQYSLKV